MPYSNFYYTMSKIVKAFVSENDKIDGIENVGKYKCYVVEIKEQGGSPFSKIWIDQKSLNMVKSEIEGPDSKTIFLYSEF